MSEPIRMPVLEARGLSKAFPGVRALADVNLELAAGRVLALLGANGAGKSTLMNVLCGVIAPDAGALVMNGQPVRFRGVKEARKAGISAIFQELSLATNLTVAENIYLSREPRSWRGTIDYRAMNQAAEAQLRPLGLAVAPDILLGLLRVGQQQVVEIARALSTRAQVLIMDEPTSALSRHETQALFKVINELKRSGVAIVYSTHKFDELAAIADDVVVMRDGRVVAGAPYAEITHDQIVQLMAGSSKNAVPRNHPGDCLLSGPERLEVRSLSLPHPTRRGDFALRDINLVVGHGEIVGLFGLVGAGRTELLESLFGLHGHRVQGQVLVDGQAVDLCSTAQAIRAGLALAPEDRKQDGLVLGMGSRENAGLASVHASTCWGLLSPSRESVRVRPWLERMRLTAASLQVPVRNLSGGNQQKVVLAKWLATSPKVLCLDEPTRGIDINAKAEIYALIRELAAAGLAVLFASSDAEEVLTLANRIVVLSEGRKTAEFASGQAHAEALLRAALPGATA